MKKRIFRSIMLTSFVILTLAVVFVMAAVHSELADSRKEEITIEASYILKAYNSASDGIDYLKNAGKDSKNRITLIAPDGNVMYDSYTASPLENHLNRPEISDALQYGIGNSSRRSNTLGESTYYYALKAADGNIIRIAATVRTLLKMIDSTATALFIIILLSVVIMTVTAKILTRQIIAPINALDTSNPLDSDDIYEELSPLVVRLDKQNKKIAEQISELASKQNEFLYITENMNESLVIFSSDGKVLTANRSACRLFRNFEPKNLIYPEFCREIGFIRLVKNALEGKASSERLELNGKILRVTADPVGHLAPEGTPNSISSDTNYAAVLFAEDITEKEQNEQIRREFSANVSHELKTPLTSIMGYAEIMQNGIAKKGDFPEFISQIYTEANRLLTLITDILHLSQLDEGAVSASFEAVNLYNTAVSVCTQLHEKAATANISLSVQGDKVTVNGIAPTLYEMLFNLCDNAVIYNRCGGSVTVDIRQNGIHPKITVTDTGIGIAPENQTRIFERFYRVDKSRSKLNGGTGLGLSIVKHSADLHHAKVSLSSTLGTGTSVTVEF